ncbi:hypothetical protein [Hugenholtzia roseola]|uniref:hypothetical protein n=1 Tax=Hugenholtzia roseola TaxID=1002 RepID=UPI0004155A28|nr:hypothetical protein [Hugenholtzia roseola]
MTLKHFFSFALLVAIFSFSFQSAKAQTTYTWEDYSLEFTVPAGFQETANSGEKFEGKSDRAGIFLFGLYPLSDASITSDNLADMLVELAAETGMEVGEAEAISFNGFEGYYAEGEIEGVPTFFACMLDPEGETNFIISILHNNATDTAVKIVTSIHKL